MYLLEHDAKELLAAAGIPTPAGVLADDAGALPALPPGPWVVKAQLAVGGRGKAGGIRKTATLAETRAAIADISGKLIRGLPVRGCRVEQQISRRAGNLSELHGRCRGVGRARAARAAGRRRHRNAVGTSGRRAQHDLRSGCRGRQRGRANAVRGPRRTAARCADRMPGKRSRGSFSRTNARCLKSTRSSCAPTARGSPATPR